MFSGFDRRVKVRTGWRYGESCCCYDVTPRRVLCSRAGQSYEGKPPEEIGGVVYGGGGGVQVSKVIPVRTQNYGKPLNIGLNCDFNKLFSKCDNVASGLLLAS